MAKSLNFTIQKNQSICAPSLMTAKISTIGTAPITTGDYIEIETGFTSRHIIIENITDKTRFEWIDGMSAGSHIKTTMAGARTYETSPSVIVVTERGFHIYANNVGALATGKELVVIAQG